MKPDVSIIIVNYNTYDLTCSCIRSVQKQTQGCSYEIILVDNASTEYAPFENEFPTIKIIRSPENIGFSKGNNLGIREASGDFLLLLNSDTELLNDAVTICKTYLLNNQSVGVVSAQLQYPSGELQSACQPLPSIFRDLLELVRLIKFFPNSIKDKYWQAGYADLTKDRYAGWVWGAFFMFPRSILSIFPNKILTDRFFMYAEDFEWCLIIQRKGYKIGFCAAAKVLHHSGASSKDSSNLKKTTQIVENELEIIRTHYPKWYARLYVLIKKWLCLSLLRKHPSYRTSYELLKKQSF